MIGSSSAGPFFEIVFMLLVAELVIIGLLTLPFPGGARGVIIRWISTSSLLAALAKPLMYFSVLVVLSFMFTTREMLKLQDEYHEARAGDLAQKLQHEARMFRAQRNFYLTGFCMVQLLVISRIYSLLKQVNKLEATQMALKKQAEGAAAAYKAVSAEKDAAAKPAAKGGDAEDAAAAAAKAQAELKRRSPRRRRRATRRSRAPRRSRSRPKG